MSPTEGKDEIVKDEKAAEKDPPVKKVNEQSNQTNNPEKEGTEEEKKQVEKQADKQAAKQAEKQSEKQSEKHVEKQPEKQADKQADKQVEKQPEKQAEKQADKQAEQRKNDVEMDEDERPMDLAAMRKFEFEQVERLTPSQLRRYEQFRRSDLKNQKIKKVLVNLNPILQKASEPYIIAVKGLTKLFVGDVVEKAIDIRMELGEKGALQPKHIREAYRRLRKDGAFPTSADKKPSFI